MADAPLAPSARAAEDREPLAHDEEKRGRLFRSGGDLFRRLQATREAPAPRARRAVAAQDLGVVGLAAGRVRRARGRFPSIETVRGAVTAHLMVSGSAGRFVSAAASAMSDSRGPRPRPPRCAMRADSSPRSTSQARYSGAGRAPPGREASGPRSGKTYIPAVTASARGARRSPSRAPPDQAALQRASSATKGVTREHGLLLAGRRRPASRSRGSPRRGHQASTVETRAGPGGSIRAISR